MSKRAERTQALAICAALTAVIVVLNFLSSLHLIRLDLIFFLVSGALVYLAAGNFRVAAGTIVFTAASLLSLLVVPDKVWLLFFIGIFGPMAILQSYLDKRWSSLLSAVIVVAGFLGLFSLFGFVAFNGNISVLNIAPGIIPLLIFAAFSALIAFFVNKGLCEFVNRRARGIFRKDASGTESGETKTSIVLPKLSPDDEDTPEDTPDI